MPSLTADELFAAGHGGSYELDPETGKRSLIKEPKTTTAAPNDGQVRRKQSHSDQVGVGLRG
jgi:hypothetical protein